MRARDHDGFPPFLTIFLAVFFGALLAMLAHDGIEELRMRYAMMRASQVLQDEVRRGQAEWDKQFRATQQQQDEIDRRMLANQSARALAERLQVERDARKAAAWSQYFQPSAACKLDSGLAQCANEHIAAKKRFEASYVDR